MTNPETSVDEVRYPRLHVGSLEIPAIFLPILVSVLFGAYKRWQRNRPAFVPRPPPVEPEKSEKNAAADPESLKQQPVEEKLSAHQKIALWSGNFGWVFVYLAILLGPLFSRSAIPHRYVIRAVSGSCMVGALGIYTCFEMGNTRSHAVALAAAGAGLIVQQDVFGQPAPWNWMFTVSMTLLALLTWWPVPQASYQKYYGYVSVLIPTLFLQMVFPETWWDDEKGKFTTMISRVVGAISILPTLAFFMWSRISVWLGLSPTAQNEVKVHSLKEIRRDALFAIILLVGSFIGGAYVPMVMNISSFLTSCIALNRLILGRSIAPPSFKNNIGGSLTAILIAYLMFRKPVADDPRRMLDHTVDGIGWPTVALLALGLVLMAVEQVRG